MKVLIVYGSKLGGTAGLAHVLADAFRSDGVTADVQPADSNVDVTTYDAVVVGGALYTARWHRSARKFVRHNTSQLRERPVFFFSSGPLDDSAREGDIPPTGQVRRLMNRIGAREHVTFGGRLPADAKGFPASAMAKDHAGDWRDTDQVKAWAHHVAGLLRQSAVA